MKILSTTEQALQRAFPGEALARTHATLSQNGVVEPYSRVARRLLEAELRGERLEARRATTAELSSETSHERHDGDEILDRVTARSRSRTLR